MEEYDKRVVYTVEVEEVRWRLARIELGRFRWIVRKVYGEAFLPCVK
jgi:hypothetical protein